MRFEQRVGAVFLAKLLAGSPVPELAERAPAAVAFQQSPATSVDDLVLTTDASDGRARVRLEVAIRRAPRFVPSDGSTADLIEALVRADLAAEEDDDAHTDLRLAVCVSGTQAHAGEVAQLAALARGQSSADAFVKLVGTPRRFSSGIRRRLGSLTDLVEAAVKVIGVDAGTPAHRTWRLLQRLWILQLDLEVGHDADWTRVVDDLRATARDHSIEAATALRETLFDLSGELNQLAGDIDARLLRRRLHGLLDPSAGPPPRDGWTRMLAMDAHVRGSVRRSIATGEPAELTFARSTVRDALTDALSSTAADLLVVGDSGAGKSAALMAAIDPNQLPADTQALVLNLRDLPTVPLDLLTLLGAPDVLFEHMTAPNRWLVIDSTEAAAGSHEDALTFLLGAARQDHVRVVAVASTETSDVVNRLLRANGRDVVEVHVPGLDDNELADVRARFPTLRRLVDDSRSREVLRRPLVVDLLRNASGTELAVSEAQALDVVWQYFVRNSGRRDHGFPEARENVVLLLAAHAIGLKSADEVMTNLDFEAVEGLRLSTFLLPASPLPWERVPAFRHDLLRAYAVARLLLADRDPAASLTAAGAPRPILPSARLACEVLLSAPDMPSYPAAGRFTVLQRGFDTIAAARGDRWADVPAEALLRIHDPRSVLDDAWPDLTASGGAGLARLLRILDVGHRHRSLLDTDVAEPVIARLVASGAPIELAREIGRLISDWLQAHVLARTPAGNPVRMALREAILAECRGRESAAAESLNQLLSDAAADAVGDSAPQTQTPPPSDGADTPDEHHRRPPPYQWIEESQIEHLAMLGLDLDRDVEALLDRVAEDEPHSIAPAVETLAAGNSIASYSPTMLGRLTKAYYIEQPDEHDEWDYSGFHNEGIREHTYTGFGLPLSHWVKGPFLALLRADYDLGVSVLNQMLDHGARGRIRVISHYAGGKGEDHRRLLALTGVERAYIGDSQVWPWYRGTGNGPEACMSALQALELVTEERIQAGSDPRALTSTMLRDAHNLAMPALALAVLVRHLEAAGDALDPFLLEPDVWQLEHGRLVLERPPFAAQVPNLPHLDRRSWSMMETAAALAHLADPLRADHLRALGAQLVDRERARLDGDTSRAAQERLATVRNWARSLDQDALQVTELGGLVHIQQVPDPEIEAVLQRPRASVASVNDAIGLELRHAHPRSDGGPAPHLDSETLAADLALARTIAAAPDNEFGLPFEGPAAVAATALELHLTSQTRVPIDDLVWSARTLLEVSEQTAGDGRDDDTMYSEAADRSAARALPLLLLPAARDIRTVLFNDDPAAIDHVVRMSRGVAVDGANESRLLYARGLDLVWAAACEAASQQRCHHRVALEVTTESYLRSRLGPWDELAGRRAHLSLESPNASSLDALTGAEIRTSQLTSAIRATSAAAISDACCAADARDDLESLLRAHQRATLHRDRGFYRSEGDALVAARAALWQARAGRDEPVLTHVRQYLASSRALSQALRALSSAAEELDESGLQLRRLWPTIMDTVLDSAHDNPRLFAEHPAGHHAESLLIPTTTERWHYRTQERVGALFPWRDMLSWQPQVERWVAAEPRSARSIDQLVIALSELPAAEQVGRGLGWLRDVVGSVGSDCIASFTLPDWLRERRSDLTSEAQNQTWQTIVDQLFLAGDTRVSDLVD